MSGLVTTTSKAYAGKLNTDAFFLRFSIGPTGNVFYKHISNNEALRFIEITDSE